MIERHGLRCLTASSGTEAVRLLMDHPEIDLIILDAILPDMSGVSVFRSLKRIKPSVRVIVCSGMRDQGPAKAIHDAGADDIMPKPFTAKDLLDRVRSLLAKHD
jgi:DNA-binding response OmpR family regulator